MKIVSAHDASIPVLGFGTWELSGKACVRSVAEAIRTGYRHIDTAAAYGNEDRVGEGIRAAGIARKEVFITTKCGPPDLDDASFKSSIERSLKLLGVDQVDLVLIHSPDKALGVAEQIATLNAVKRNGWTRHIGVSQFHDAVAVRGLGDDPRATRHQSMRIPPLSQPRQAHRRLPRRGHDLYRLRAARPSGRPRRSGDLRGRQTQGPRAGAGRPPLEYPAGRDRDHPEERELGPYPVYRLCMTIRSPQMLRWKG